MGPSAKCCILRSHQLKTSI